MEQHNPSELLRSSQPSTFLITYFALGLGAATIFFDLFYLATSSGQLNAASSIKYFAAGVCTLIAYLYHQKSK